MILVETEEGPAPCPDTITIIGGGRWARVLVEVLCRLVAPSVAICVYSRRNTRSMAIWAQARGLAKRVELFSTWPRPFSTGLGAVVVANAARDHETAVEWALSAGAPVMVEKPIALTGVAAERLADLARQRNVPFAAAHVFLFARYLDNFSKLIRNAGRIDSLHVDWADPESEERYGERKRYDPGLPVFADWLPHVVSIVGSLVSRVPDNCRILEVRRGGAAVDLELMVGSIPCSVRMERNAERRRRIVQAFAQGQMFQLDFSREPGTINGGAWTMTGDQYWDYRMRPAARMLIAFLKWAAGGERDGRLDIDPGLRACKLIDDAREMYRSAVVPWLKARLTAAEPGDEDLCYALAELLQAEGPLSSLELDRQIDMVRTRFSKTNGERWLEELIRARDAARLSYIVRGVRKCGVC